MKGQVEADFGKGGWNSAKPLVKVVAIGFLAFICAASARMAPSMLLIPLTVHFGWSREEISFGMALNLLAFGLSGPFLGAAIIRFGIRSCLATGLTLFGSAAFVSQFMTDGWQYQLLWGLAAGIGSGAVGPVMAASLASRWFQRRQGLILGFFSSSNAIAAVARQTG